MAEPLSSRNREIQTLADSLEKPLLDNREYRVIKLPNQLEALLIHDAETDKAAAAMDVNIGSFSDPEDMPGMAHAVEHLLFMGTEKYPGENDYNTYLTKYGGNSNAFTNLTSTNYYFELSTSSTAASTTSSTNTSQTSIPIPKHKAPLYGALDRFSQFFVNPLFLEDTLDRELQAVDSENKKNLQSDPWRLQQLNRSTSGPQHPYHKFATGSYKLLHDDPLSRGVKIREAFINFYKTHYSANRMKLAVLGKESLDELESWVQEFFSDVKNQDLPQLRWDGVPICSEEDIRTQMFVKPVMDQRKLDIFFPYPDEEDLYASRPSRYISHLIGHEGPGSILAYIKDKGWATSLSAGVSPICPGSAIFSVNTRLTESGLKNYREIVMVIFQYIAMVKEQPPQQWIVDEMSKLAEVDFTYRQKIPASTTVSGLSGTMQRPIPRDQLLSAQSLIRKFNPEAITLGLEALNPENFRLSVVSQEFADVVDRKEKWYGTEYKYEKIPSDFMEEIRRAASSASSQRPRELYLPGVNEFVPQRLEVEKKDIPEPSRTPTLIRNDLNVRTWFKKDDQFWVPKANIFVWLRSPVVGVTPLVAVMGQLYKELVEDSLMEYAYDAEIAGLAYSIAALSNGIDVSVTGYNDKMPVLLEKVLVSMRDLEVRDDRFDIMKERLMRGYKNFEYQDPYTQSSSYTRYLTSETSWATFELLEEINSVTAEDVRQFFPQALRQMHIEVFVHGNLYKEDALNITNLVESTLKPKRLPPSQWPTRRTIELPRGSDYRYERVLRDPNNINHCIDYVIFVGDDTDRVLRAKLLLLSSIGREPVFNTLRTKEQLGYVVGSNAMVNVTLAGWRIVVQSEKECAYLEKRIDSFLVGFEETIRDMSQEEFEAHKVGLINKRLERVKNLDQESYRFWAHITKEAFDFELVWRDVEHIEPLTKEDILEFYRYYIHPDSPHRAKATIYLKAQSSAADLAAKTSSSEKREKLVETVSQMLEQLGLEDTNTVDLTKRLEKVDLAAGNAKDIMVAVGGYLKESAGMAAEQVEALIEQGQTVLASVLPSLGIVPIVASEETAQPNGEVEVNGESTTKKTVVIEDVKAFKASMPLSAGVRPVKDLSEFEELGAKL